VIQLERLLRRYGPEADDVRDLLCRYTAMRLQDLFPAGGATPVLEDPKTLALFEELEDRLAKMEGNRAYRRWLLSQALALTTDLTGGAVAFGRAKRAGNSGSSVAGGVVLAVPAFHEFRPVRTH
jgi:hypothetical protein